MFSFIQNQTKRYFLFNILNKNINHEGFKFSSDKWRQRDEASQKVYISQQQKNSIKKLLKKVQEDQQSRLNNNAQFESKFRDILKKYKITNEAFFSQVSNLHKNLND